MTHTITQIILLLESCVEELGEKEDNNSQGQIKAYHHCLYLLKKYYQELAINEKVVSEAATRPAS